MIMELWMEKLKSLRLLYAEDEDGIRKPMANTLSYYLVAPEKPKKSLDSGLS